MQTRAPRTGSSRSRKTRLISPKGRSLAGPLPLGSTPAPARAASRASARAPAPPAGTGLPSGSGRKLTLEELAERIRVCTECPLHLSRTLAVPGAGKPTARIMIIGEAPGGKEDKTGQPFVGSAGRYLDHILKGTSFGREDFFITNIVKCRPAANRPPQALEIQTCTSLYLVRQIEVLNPRLILLLGAVAVKAMLGVKSVEEVRGRVIEREGRKYLASYHPAVRFYREDLAAKIKADFALLTRELDKLAP